jgi:hypothetical protein
MCDGILCVIKEYQKQKGHSARCGAVLLTYFFELESNISIRTTLCLRSQHLHYVPHFRHMIRCIHSIL